jgi:integrase/recombinase XerD
MVRESSPVHISEVLSDVVSHLRGKKPNLSSFSSTFSSAQRPRRQLLTLSEYSDEDELFARVLRTIARLDMAGKDHLYLHALDMYRRNCKLRAIMHCTRSVGMFLQFLKDRRQTQIEAVTRADLEAFVEHEQDRGLKPLSVRTYLERVYTFLHFLIEEEVVSPEIVRRRIRLRLPQQLPRAMEPDDVTELLSVIGKRRDRAMVLVLLRTGMRIGELLETRVSDINLKEHTITIWQGMKNRRGRVVYFSGDALCALRAWLRRRDATKPLLFYGQGRNSLTYQGARVMFKKYLSKARLSHKGYTLHCLRHTYASELLNAGMRLECLQQLLGHDNIEITRRYARLTDKTRKEEYFRAMAKIEKGEIHGSYRLDSELQTILKEKELLNSYRKELSV